MKFSIVLTTFNRSHHLYFCLRSLRDQLIGTDHEIIVVNDGNDDETENVVKTSDAAKGLNIRYFYTGGRPDNSWRVMGFAANIGIQQAKGEIVVLSNSDVYHHGITVKPVIENAIKNPWALSTLNKVFDDDGRLIKALNLQPFNLKLHHSLCCEISSANRKLPGCYPANPDIPFFMAVRKECLMKVGGYDEDFTGVASEDCDLIDRLEAIGCRHVYAPKGAEAIHLYHGRKTIAELHAIPGFSYNLRLRKQREKIIVRNVGREWGKLPKNVLRVALVYFNNDQMVSRGVGYIASAIRSAKAHVTFYDTKWTDQNKVLKDIDKLNYDLVLLSSTSFYVRRAYQFAEQVKQISSIPILLGGAHATVSKAKILEDCKAIDYICVGEGEEFIAEFLGRLKHGNDLTTIKNLGYRDVDGKVMINPSRPCTDLHKLKPFDHGLFDPRSVVTEQALLPGFTYVFATRGCPFSCTYCCNSSFLELYGRSFLRTQKIETVIQELKTLRANYPVKLFYFGDEMILFDREYVKELFTQVKKELNMPYGCMFRAEYVNEETVDLLRRTGCVYAAIGVECGDEQFRHKFLNRHDSNQKIIQAFKLLRTIPGIFLVTFNMKGYPVSYDDELTRKTEQLNKQLNPNHSQTTWFYPIEGTRLYDYCVEHDLIDWDKYHSIESYFRHSVLKHPIPIELDHDH